MSDRLLHHELTLLSSGTAAHFVLMCRFRAAQLSASLGDLYP